MEGGKQEVCLWKEVLVRHCAGGEGDKAASRQNIQGPDLHGRELNLL